MAPLNLDNDESFMVLYKCVSHQKGSQGKQFTGRWTQMTGLRVSPWCCISDIVSVVAPEDALSDWSSINEGLSQVTPSCPITIQFTSQHQEVQKTETVRRSLLLYRASIFLSSMNGAFS